jgi:hypothetical protein
MTCKTWTTADQEKWRKNNLNKFLVAKASDMHQEFFKATYLTWLVRWLKPEPSQAELYNVSKLTIEFGG